MVLGRKLWGVLAKARHIKQFRPEASLFLFFLGNVTFKGKIGAKISKKYQKHTIFLHLQTCAEPSGHILLYLYVRFREDPRGCLTPRAHISLNQKSLSESDRTSQKVTDLPETVRTDENWQKMTKSDKNWEKSDFLGWPDENTENTKKVSVFVSFWQFWGGVPAPYHR